MVAETMWICPECGQWGLDEFGKHRLPEATEWPQPTCDVEPVRIVSGPFLRQMKKRWAEIVAEAGS